MQDEKYETNNLYKLKSFELLRQIHLLDSMRVGRFPLKRVGCVAVEFNYNGGPGQACQFRALENNGTLYIPFLQYLSYKMIFHTSNSNGPFLQIWLHQNLLNIVM